MMGLVDVLSLSYPTDTIKRELFHAKVFSFFSYSISNMLGLIFGALLISLVLHSQGTPIDSIVPYFMMTAAIALSVFFLSLYVEKKKPTAQQLHKLLVLRIILGCGIGLMYGMACFLLPTESAGRGVLFLVLIYLVSISVAIFQYSVIPAYYILFNVFVYVPLFVFLFLNEIENFFILVLLLITGIVLFFSKGLKVSINAINALAVNLELQSEISEHVETRKKLQDMALYDDLTKVANRFLFKKSAEASLDRAISSGHTMALLYIDLDNFKYINDHFGHFVGDKVLIETADKIRARVRASDLVARLGGDEFVVILENFNKGDAGRSLIDDIYNGLNTVVEINGHSINVCASIGRASYPLNGSTVEAILHAADEDMYKHKKSIRKSGLYSSLSDQSSA